MTGLAPQGRFAEWLAGYSFFDLATVTQPEPWREKQVLSWFDQFGRNYFQQLDIWDIAWASRGTPAESVFDGCPHGPVLPEEVQLARELIQKTQAGIAAGELSAARTSLQSVLRILPGDASLARSSFETSFRRWATKPGPVGNMSAPWRCNLG